MKFNKNTTFY